jgi:hypothetical protein
VSSSELCEAWGAAAPAGGVVIQQQQQRQQHHQQQQQQQKQKQQVDNHHQHKRRLTLMLLRCAAVMLMQAWKQAPDMKRRLKPHIHCVNAHLLPKVLQHDPALEQSSEKQHGGSQQLHH